MTLLKFSGQVLILNIMADTLAQKLARVQTAIAAIESGAQSISVEGRTYTRANLQTLYDREDQLELKIAREAGTSVSRTISEI